MQVWSCAERGGKKAKTDLVEDQTSDLRTIETGYVKKYETTVHMYYIYICLFVCLCIHTVFHKLGFFDFLSEKSSVFLSPHHLLPFLLSSECRFQAGKINLSTKDVKDLKHARKEGTLHEALLDRREKTKADRYCK